MRLLWPLTMDAVVRFWQGVFPASAVPIGLVKASCFPCVVNQWPSGPIDPWLRGSLRAWVVHRLGAPTATAAIKDFFREVRMRVLENLDHSSGGHPWELNDSILLKSLCSHFSMDEKKK